MPSTKKLKFSLEISPVDEDRKQRRSGGNCHTVGLQPPCRRQGIMLQSRWHFPESRSQILAGIQEFDHLDFTDYRIPMAGLMNKIDEGVPKPSQSMSVLRERLNVMVANVCDHNMAGFSFRQT